jgi:hypothetical protein
MGATTPLKVPTCVTHPSDYPVYTWLTKPLRHEIRLRKLCMACSILTSASYQPACSRVLRKTDARVHEHPVQLYQGRSTRRRRVPPLFRSETAVSLPMQTDVRPGSAPIHPIHFSLENLRAVQSGMGAWMNPLQEIQHTAPNERQCKTDISPQLTSRDQR